MPSPANKTPLRLGLAGLGTVGLGVVKIVQEHAEMIALRAGRPVVITAVSAPRTAMPIFPAMLGKPIPWRLPDAKMLMSLSR